jgi:hypothetical protein
MNFFKTARDGGTFDYNCDGKIEFEQPAFVDCAPVGGLICDTNTHGFLGKVHPACGTTANTGSCVVSMIGECKEQIEQPNVDVLCR